MPGLLAPLFLLGALAVAVPVIVHLVHRERKQPLAFPSLMFLRRVPFRSAKRQRIRFWLLFLLRSLALLLIAAAFARPWLKADYIAAHAGNAGNDIVLLIDRSYSLSGADAWAKVQRAAREVIEQADEADRVAVIAFSEQAEVLARLDEPRTRAIAAVNALKPTSDVTRYAPALRLASSALTRSRGNAEIVVITDAQRNGWRNVAQVDVPAGTRIRVAEVRAAGAGNLALSNARTEQAVENGRSRITPGAVVLNRGDRAERVDVELRMGERVQQLRSVNVPARGQATVQFEPVYGQDDVGEIRLASGDAVAADDAAFFSFDAQKTADVRIVSENAQASFFFENALRAGDASAFALHRAGARLSAADLAQSDVLVYLDAALPGGAAADRIEEFVRQGGGLVVVGDVRGDILPVRGSVTVTRTDAPLSIVSIDDGHPVFEAFRAGSGDAFAAARVTRYVRTRAVEDALVLARLDDGSPAVVEGRIGRGRVLYVATPLTRDAGDLVLQPAFVPFVQELVRYAMGSARVPRSYTVGNVIDVNAFAPADGEAVVITPSRERVRISANGARTFRLAERGIYQVRGTGAGAMTQQLAVNVDPSESDLTAMPHRVFADALAERRPVAAVATAALSPLEREQRQSLWWYLLLLAFAMLAVETIWANRISGRWL